MTMREVSWDFLDMAIQRQTMFHEFTKTSPYEASIEENE